MSDARHPRPPRPFHPPGERAQRRALRRRIPRLERAVRIAEQELESVRGGAGANGPAIAKRHNLDDAVKRLEAARAELERLNDRDTG